MGVRMSLLGAAIATFAIAAIADTTPPEVRTQHALALVLARDYEAFYNLFSPEMKRSITLEHYSREANQIVALGTPKSQGPPVAHIISDSTLVMIPLHWDVISLNFLVSWNKAGQIQGTWFRPPDPPKWVAPAYSDATKFSSRDVSFGKDPWILPATLTVPNGKGPFPGLVLVHGSGPNDRDESVGGVKPFRDLAEGLATRGIAVLRYDKRTRVYPTQSMKDPNFTMTNETVDDAIAAAEFLRQQPQIDPTRVFVAGHSQGGYMMPRILKADPGLAGGIILAGNVRPLEELIVDQSIYLSSLKSTVTDEEKAQLDALKKNPSSALAFLPERYRDDLHGYNPANEATQIRRPLLILQGERDYQVTMRDFVLWKSALGARPDVTMISYPALNHLLVAGQGKPSPAEYEHPGHVDGQVVADIARWVPSAGAADETRVSKNSR